MRSFSRSNFSTLTVISSPAVTTSEGCVHAPVRHVADVQQPVDSAQIDEGAVVGQILDDSGNHAAFFQHLQRRALARVLLFLHRHLARHHHVAAAAVQLDDLDRNVLAQQRIQIVGRPHVNLRAGHERGNAHIHRQARL